MNIHTQICISSYENNCSDLLFIEKLEVRALPEERVNIITAHYLRGIKCFTDLKIE